MDDYILDLNRENRIGFPEVIFWANKSSERLRRIFDDYEVLGKNALATRVQPEKAAVLLEAYPDSRYDDTSQSFVLHLNELASTKANIGIINAGSSDLPAVNEACFTLNFLETPATRINDVGVAGIHRLLDRLDELRMFKILVVVAGFEGALPSVVGGLLPQPIIAVPTSVGYRAAQSGRTALNAMLSSCANGIAVTNIDNGYGAAMAAFRILKQTGKDIVKQ